MTKLNLIRGASLKCLIYYIERINRTSEKMNDPYGWRQMTGAIRKKLNSHYHFEPLLPGHNNQPRLGQTSIYHLKEFHIYFIK